MPDELLVLGSSSGQPTGRRFATAYALTAASKLFLIDCGAPVSTLLYRYDLDPTDVQAVFLSHWHMDHIAGLGLFLSQNRLLKRPSPLNIYGPRGTPSKTRRLLTDSFLLPDALGFELNIISVKNYKRIKKALIRVTYFETRHLAGTRHRTQFGRKAVACGMRIDGPGWCIVYSGDLHAPEELSPYVNDCDVLVHEMTHVHPGDVANFAETARVPHVLISHIGPEFDETPERIVEAFQDRYTGQLTVAEDGTRIQLSKSP